MKRKPSKNHYVTVTKGSAYLCDDGTLLMTNPRKVRRSLPKMLRAIGKQLDSCERNAGKNEMLFIPQWFADLFGKGS